MIPPTDALADYADPAKGTLAGRLRLLRVLLLRRDLLLPIAALWAALLVVWMAAYAHPLGGFVAGPVLGQASFEAASWMVMAVIGVPAGWLLPTGRRARPLQVAGFLAVSLLLVTIRVEAIRQVLPYLGKATPPFLVTFIFYLPRSLFVATSFVGCGFAMRMILQEQARRAETAQVQAQAVAARLEALRHRLRPRLFMACVDVISRRMRPDPDAADRLVLQLSDLLRAQLARGRTEHVRLADEMDFAARYLRLEAECAPLPLDVQVHTDADVRDVEVPANCVAVLAEATVRAHAAAGGAPGRLALSAAGDGAGGVRVTARDDVPVSVEQRRAAGLLDPVRELADTLAARPGPACAVGLEDGPEGGVVATLHLAAR